VNTHSTPLFREEALRHRVDRLHGNVAVAIPLAWQFIGFLLLFGLIATMVFISLASYSRVETVQGVVALDKGVASILPSRAGVVEAVLVAEGDTVRAGQRLAVVRADESLVGGGAAPERIREALTRQDAQLSDQARLVLDAATADRQRLSAQIEGDRAAVASLQAQITDQRDLVNAAELDYRTAAEVAKRGFISKRDVETRRATILTRRQQLEQLQQGLSAKQAEIEQARRSMAQASMTAQAQAAGARSSQASLAQQRVQADVAQGYVLTAPFDGIVTALTVRAGQPVGTDQQLMMVVPPHARSRAELYVPSAASGFIHPGQEVRLSIDAFNYQTFGTIGARVATVSQAAVSKASQSGTTPVYLVTAAIDRPWITAFGRRQPLLPGMTLSARVVTQKRSLVQWLFEPLFAVRRR
jgi:membrane fusion protein